MAFGDEVEGKLKAVCNGGGGGVVHVMGEGVGRKGRGGWSWGGQCGSRDRFLELVGFDCLSEVESG